MLLYLFVIPTLSTTTMALLPFVSVCDVCLFGFFYRSTYTSINQKEQATNTGTDGYVDCQVFIFPFFVDPDCVIFCHLLLTLLVVC